MSHKMLPILLRDIDDIAAISSNTGFPCEVFSIGKKASPLGLEEVNDVQVFSLRFCMGSLC